MARLLPRRASRCLPLAIATVYLFIGSWTSAEPPELLPPAQRPKIQPPQFQPPPTAAQQTSPYRDAPRYQSVPAATVPASSPKPTLPPAPPTDEAATRASYVPGLTPSSPYQRPPGTEDTTWLPPTPPKASTLQAAEQSPKQTPPSPPHPSSLHPTSLHPTSSNAWTATSNATTTTEVYQVSDLVEAMAAQYEVSVADAKQLLGYEMRRTLRGDTGQFGWNNSNLVVRASQRYHEIYQQRLSTLRSSVFEELEMAVCLASVDSQIIRQLGLSWQVQATAPMGDPQGPAPLNSATATTTRHQPLKWAVVPQQQSRTIEAKLRTSQGFQVLGRPQMRLFNGRRAVAESAVERRFVVAVDDQKPQIQTIPHGWKLDVLPETRGEQAIVRGHCTFSDITGVETVESEQRIQIPEVQHTRMSWTNEIPLGATLVVAGNRTPYTSEDKVGWKETVILLRVTRVGDVAEADETAQLESQLETRLYSVASLLPEDEAKSKRRIQEVAELLSASLREKSGAPGEVVAQWSTRSLKIRQTARGHRTASSLINALTTLNRPKTKLQLRVLSISEEACSEAGWDDHAGFVVVNRSAVDELAEDDRAVATTVKPTGEGAWKLADGTTIRATVQSPLASHPRKTGDLIQVGRIARIDAVHQRGEVIEAECRRELTGNTALLLEVTPDTPPLDSLPTLSATIRRTLSLEPTAQRKFVLIETR